MSLSDAQLAERFVATRDHDAFATLVARHGPMVMAVCRGSLGRSGDADDAFQATFLVLLNRLGEFTVGASLGGWLHRVARRVARQALRSRDRRVRREAVASSRIESSPSRDPERSEIIDVIRQEIDILPKRYRAPLVLCDLEGLSRDEAAELLGCPPGTVGGRLARARKRLRERLERRGVEPSLVPLAASADAWRTSLDAAVRSASALSAGSSPTPVVLALATRSAGLAASVPVKATAALVVAACLAGGMLAAGRPTEPSPPPKQASQPPKAPAVSPEFEDPALAGHYVGKVVDLDGRPVPGARLFIVRYDPEYHPAPKEIGPARTRTGPDGRFEFNAPDMKFIDYDGLPFRRQGLLVAAAEGYAPDWIVTWGRKRSTFRSHWDPIMGADLTLRLTRGDVPIHGRILDHEGRPIAGARVKAASLSIPRDHDLDAHIKVLTESQGLAGSCHDQSISHPGLLPGVSADATTDEDGRFRISGLGRDRLVDLTIAVPGNATQHLTVMTREAPDAVIQPGLNLNGRSSWVIPGAGFTYRLARDDRITITGVVRDRDTHQPIPGVWVGRDHWALLLGREDFEHAVTDADGRFSISGIAPKDLAPPPPQSEAVEAIRAGTYPNPVKLVAIPRPGQPYLRAGVTALNASDLVIECVRGVPFRLKVVDEDGRPVEGRVEAHAVNPNPYLDRMKTSADEGNAPVGRALKTGPGVYEGVLMPGPGAVVVETPDFRDYRPPLLDPKAFFAPGKTDWTDRELSDAYGTTSLLMLEDMREAQECYAAVMLVNPPVGSEPLELSATVVRGRPRVVTLVDPEGRPVVGASPEGLTEHPADYEPPLRAATFPLMRLHPDRVRRMTFVREDRKLIGSLLARGDGDAPYTVVMQPWATVTGRFVDLRPGTPEEKGSPFLDMDSRSRIADHDDPAKGAFPQTWPDREGRFRVERLVPGLSYRAAVYRNGVRVGVVGRTLAVESAFKDLILKPGEVRDLGDVRVPE